MSRTAIILGSNCESVSSRIKIENTIPFSAIPGFPEIAQSVPGHALEVLIGTIDGASVLCYNGRMHCYQGLTPYEVSANVRHAYHAGCDTVIIATGAATLGDSPQIGELMAVTDHINVRGDSPLIGPTVLFPDDVPFVDMYNAYDPKLVEVAEKVAAKQGITLRKGVQVCMVGPQYLTPFEASFFSKAGCSTVSLSGVAEVIQARALGMRVLCISNINSHAGQPTKRRPVDEMLVKSSDNLGHLIAGVVTEISK